MQFLDNINRRLIGLAILAITVLGIIGMQTTTAEAKLTHQVTPPLAHTSTLIDTKSNVYMFYGLKYPHYNYVRYTQAYNGTDYQYDWHSGTLKSYLYPQTGAYVRLVLTPRERFVSGYVSYYGYQNDGQELQDSYSWDGLGTVPTTEFAKGDDGNTYVLMLSNLSVNAYDPARPAPQNCCKGGGMK
jgi:hypothetical protein